jgi:N-acetylglucosamine kinase-like BadF-type ATPase
MQPPGGDRAAGAARTAERRPGRAESCLVVDAGRTRLRAAVYDGGGVPRTSTDGPGLPDVADGHGSAGPFAAALAPLLRHLALPRRPLDVVCVGMTGVLRPGPAAAAVAEAVRELLPARRVLVTSDVVTGYCGAVGLGPGVVVAAGTGVIALAAGPRGVARVDGWGYLLGDAGSGFEIGRRGLAAALRAHDGRGGSKRLSELAAAALGPLDEVVERVYGAPNSVGAVAAFAAQVADAARHGDQQAKEIWEDAAREVADTALAAANRALGPAPTGEGATLSWTGGLFDAADLLLEPFLARVAAVRPELVARPPLGSALAGGRRLAGAPEGHPLLDLVHVTTA